MKEKRTLKTIILIAICIISSDSLLTSTKKSLSILHFNDAYDIEKSSKFTGEFMLRNDKDTLRLFSGDIYSPSTVTLFEMGKQFRELLERLNLHAAVMGNHEIDLGIEWFLSLKKLNNLDWLNANLKFKNGTLIGNTLEYKIINISGLKVGVFGLIDNDWVDSSILNIEEIQLDDIKTSARRISKFLKTEKCDLIIALTHMENKSDRILLEDSENYVDIILGGHDHIYYIELNNNRLLLKSGCDFSHFSNLKIEITKTAFEKTTNESTFYSFLLDKKNEDLVNQKYFHFSLNQKREDRFLNIRIEKVEIQTNSPSDQIIDNFLQTKIKPLTNSFSKPIFYLEADLETRGQIIRHHESAVCDFLADLIRIDLGVDVSIFGSGGFRLEKLLPKGSLMKYIDAIHLLPFREEMMVFHLSGLKLKELLEQGVNMILGGSQYLVVSGVSALYEINQETNERIDRQSILINGELISDKKMYNVATTSYFGKGKGGLSVFSEFHDKAQLLEDSSPLEILKRTWEITDKHQHIQEFRLFKKHFKFINLDKLFKISKKPESKKVYYGLHESMLSHENIVLILKKMSSTALKRIKVYSLMSDIKETKGGNVFSINLSNVMSRIDEVIAPDL